MEATEIHTDILVGYKIDSEIDADGGFSIFVRTIENEFVAHSRFTKTKNHDGIPEDLEKIINTENCSVFLSNIGVVEKFRGQGIGKTLYLISLKKLIGLQDGDVMELIQDQSKRKSGDTQWENTKRQELDSLLIKDNIQSLVLWNGSIDNNPSKLIKYEVKHSNL